MLDIQIFKLQRDDDIYEHRIMTEYKIIDTIDSYVNIIGKEVAPKKTYFLKNGYIACPSYSSIRQSDFYPAKTYSFAVYIKKFKEYKERFILILSCGSFERTLIIPPEDVPKILKDINISKGNRWQFHILEDMKLLSDRSIDLTKYLNKWEIIERYDIKIEDMDDKIRLTELRTKIYEHISKLSKENKKCNHLYLCNYLYSEKFSKYDILYALRFLEEKATIYKIVYVDWYVKERFRGNNIEETDKLLIETDKLLIDTFIIIKNFSIRYNWQYGIKKSDLYDNLLSKGYNEKEIRNSLKLLEERKIIYKKSFIYWFTHEYKGIITLKGDFLEDRDKDIIYMPDKTDKIEEKDIEKALEPPEEKPEEEIKPQPQEVEKPEEDIKPQPQEVETEKYIKENIFSDIPFKIEFLTKKWEELTLEQIKIENERQKEIEEQKELECRREESVKKQKLLEERILGINKQKDLLEKQFEPIRMIYDQFGKMEVGEKK